MWSTGEIVGTAFGVYVTTVVLLYRFPRLLHKRKMRYFDSFLIAHRGGAAEHVENTMEAFKHAVYTCKADILELDLHLTKDKQIVVLHDSKLKRCTGVDCVVEEMDYADLPPLLRELDVTFDPGTTSSPQAVDTNIPLFEDLLKEFPDTVMNIDMKKGTPELVGMTADMLRRYNRCKRVVWGSATNVMELCYETDPNILMFFSTRRVYRLGFLFWTGLLAFMPIREHVLELPYLTPASLELAKSRFSPPIVWILKNQELIFFNRFIITYLKRRGVETYVFVVNDEESWHKMYNLGMAGIHTDFPSKLRQFLDDNPQYIKKFRDDVQAGASSVANGRH